MRVFEIPNREFELVVTDGKLRRRPCLVIFVEVEDESEFYRVIKYVDKAVRRGITVFKTITTEEVTNVGSTSMDTKYGITFIFRACFDKIPTLENIIKELLSEESNI